MEWDRRQRRRRRREESEACFMCISYYTQQSRPIIWFQVDVIKGFAASAVFCGLICLGSAESPSAAGDDRRYGDSAAAAAAAAAAGGHGNRGTHRCPHWYLCQASCSLGAADSHSSTPDKKFT